MSDETASTTSVIVRPINTWLLAAVLAVSVGGFGSGWIHLQRQNEALKTTVRDLAVAIEQQGSLVHRVVGTVVPVRIPEGSEQELIRIEQALSSHGTLLESQAETQALAHALARLVERLPTWVQAELFPRILPARWQLDTLQILQRELSDDIDDLQDLAEALAAQALKRPQGAPEQLERRLLERAEAATQEASRRDAAASAERTRERQRQALVEKIKGVESDAELFQRLNDVELKLRLAVSIHTTTQDLKIAAMASGLQETELNRRIDVLVSDASKRVETLHQALNHKQQAIAREYQRWALKQIRDVPELQAIKDKRLAELSGTGVLGIPVGKERKDALQLAQDDLVGVMSEKLAVIDVRLLDEAVGEWYRKVFSSRFASLDQAHQLTVVEAFANSNKRSMEELP